MLPAIWENLAYLQAERENWLLEAGEDGPDWHIPLSPDRFHKANISGGQEYSLHPLGDIDCAISWWVTDSSRLATRTPLLDYLNLSFYWGGFPGLAFQPDAVRSQLPLDRLRAGLKL